MGGSRAGGRATTLVIALIYSLVQLCVVVQSLKLPECCMPGATEPSDFCKAFNTLSSMDKMSLDKLLDGNCPSDFNLEAIKQRMNSVKRQPHFIRFGKRSSDDLSFGKKGADPNFLRFGRALQFEDDELSTAKRQLSPGANANFLRFGKSSVDPNFLRFGKRSTALLVDESAEPNFMRFGRKLPNSNNFLRFGRSVDKFDREYRKPNFLRFG